MSGSPVVRVTVASPVPVIRVAAPTMPAVVRVQSLGMQGPPGPQGTQGPAGDPARYGQLRVADMHVDPEDYFAANVRQPLVFTPDPAQTQNFLRPPFDTVAWVGNRIVPRLNGYGDWQDIIVNLLVIPQYAGGSIIADIDVGTGAPVQTAFYALRGSGTAERATFRLGTQTLTSFQSNGGRIYLTGTVPFVVQSESIVYLPLSEGPGLP